MGEDARNSMQGSVLDKTWKNKIINNSMINYVTEQLKSIDTLATKSKVMLAI